MRVDHDGLVPAPGAPSGELAAAVEGGKRLSPAAIWRRLTPEHAFAVVLGLLVLVVHDLTYILTQSFWNDESWVAVTTRFPWSRLRETTASTPIAWTALMRLITVREDQVGRLLPLAFAAAAVLVAYWFGRRLGWPHREASVVAAVLAALGVLLVPAMLARDDLKQYTADAFMALLIMAILSRLERQWSRWGLVGLSVAVWGGMLFSDAAAFVGIAGFCVLCLAQLVKRSWVRLAEAAVAAVCTAVLALVVYKAFDANAVRPRLTNSPQFVPYYLPLSKGLHAMITFVTVHFDHVHSYFGLGPAWLAVPLVVAGLVTMGWLGRPVTAVTVAVLWFEMLALSALKKFPFLNQRTSTFLFAVTIVVAAVGIVGICSLLLRWLKSEPRIARVAAAAVAVLALAGLLVAARPYIRSHLIPPEDVRGQTLYVAAHAAPDDVILVNLNSNWGFAYYWPHGSPSLRPAPALLQGREAYFPGQPRIVVARDRDLAGVEAVLSEALGQAQQRSCVRVWLIRTHVISSEQKAWVIALRQHGLTATPVGRSGLTFVRAGRSCAS